MPIVYLSFIGEHCDGCLTSIEHALYTLGVEQFNYDFTYAHAKIVFDRNLVELDQIMHTISKLGFEPNIVDLIEYDEDIINGE
ncbi:MAG: heavy-metal-associated domain-containing protein [Firmicutes bacterium]|nr:heavy-metal-associated domain-containing protein [Bacillota bacterium]